MKLNSEPACNESITSPEIDELARELLEMNLSYSKQVSQLAKFLAASGEYSVLYYLFLGECTFSAGELAEKLGLTPGRIANVLKALEKKGYVCRNQDPEDRRRIHVGLTDTGYHYISSVCEEANKVYRSLVEGIGERDAREFIRITKKILSRSSTYDERTSE